MIDTHTLYENVRLALVDDEDNCLICGQPAKDGHKLNCAYPNSFNALESLYEIVEAQWKVVEAARSCRLWRTIREEDVRALDVALTGLDEKGSP